MLEERRRREYNKGNWGEEQDEAWDYGDQPLPPTDPPPAAAPWRVDSGNYTSVMGDDTGEKYVRRGYQGPGTDRASAYELWESSFSLKNFPKNYPVWELYRELGGQFEYWTGHNITSGKDRNLDI